MDEGWMDQPGQSDFPTMSWHELNIWSQCFFLFMSACIRPSAGVIWYFEPHGKLNPGSIYIHGILNPLIENWTPLYGKLNPPHF
jgi:hypothetical protein